MPTTFLVGFASDQPDDEALANACDVLDIDGHQLGAAKRAGIAEQDQSAIPQIRPRAGGDGAKDLLDDVGGGRRGLVGCGAALAAGASERLGNGVACGPLQGFSGA